VVQRCLNLASQDLERRDPIVFTRLEHGKIGLGREAVEVRLGKVLDLLKADRRRQCLRADRSLFRCSHFVHS
jgi:hypothetical protein